MQSQEGCVTLLDNASFFEQTYVNTCMCAIDMKCSEREFPVYCLECDFARKEH